MTHVASRSARSSVPTSRSTSRRPIRSRHSARRPGSLADVVVDVTAKAPAALGQAVRARASRGNDRRGGDTRQRRDARVRPGPDRLQGAARARRARRRRGGIRTGARAPRVGPVPVRRPCRAGPSVSTASATLLRDMAGEGGTPPVHGVVAARDDRLSPMTEVEFPALQREGGASARRRGGPRLGPRRVPRHRARRGRARVPRTRASRCATS